MCSKSAKAIEFFFYVLLQVQASIYFEREKKVHK
jgi:hypothetical protein